MKCFKTKYLILKSLVCKRQAQKYCDHRVWYLERPQTSLVDFTAKSGALVRLKTQWTLLKNQKILGSFCGQINQESFQSLKKPNSVIASSFFCFSKIYAQKYSQLSQFKCPLIREGHSVAGP